jgi:hypothetical protein
MLDQCVGDDRKRYDLTQYLTGYRSSNDIPKTMILAMLDWLNPQETGQTDEGVKQYVPDWYAQQEARKVLDRVLKDQGQITMKGFD